MTTLADGEIEIDKPKTGDLTITLHTAKTMTLSANKKLLHHAVKLIDSVGDEFEVEWVDENEINAEILEIRQNVVTL